MINKLEKEFIHIVVSQVELPTGTEKAIKLNNTGKECAKVSKKYAIEFGQFVQDVPKKHKDIRREKPNITVPELYNIWYTNTFENQ